MVSEPNQISAAALHHLAVHFLRHSPDPLVREGYGAASNRETDESRLNWQALPEMIDQGCRFLYNVKCRHMGSLGSEIKQRSCWI